MAQHSSLHLRDWLSRRPPMERSQDHPLTIRGRDVWLEVDELLLISIREPTLAVRLLGCWLK